MGRLTSGKYTSLVNLKYYLNQNDVLNHGFYQKVIISRKEKRNVEQRTPIYCLCVCFVYNINEVYTLWLKLTQTFL